MANKQHYKYVITLDTPMWPRKIADELSYARSIDAHLVGVTDLQNDGHMYGDTYTIKPSEPPKASISRTIVASN
jgi:hypothetical protein